MAKKILPYDIYEKVSLELNTKIGHSEPLRSVNRGQHTVRVTILKENRSVFLSRSYVAKAYDSISEYGTITNEVIRSLLNTYPALIYQIEGNFLDEDVDLTSNIGEAVDLSSTPKAQVNNFFQNVFDRGELKWDGSLNSYAYVRSTKKKNKPKKNKKVSIPISDEISNLIKGLTNMKDDYFKVLDMLKDYSPKIKNDMVDVIVTRDGYLNFDGTIGDIVYLESLVDKWNSYYHKKVFVLKPSFISCAGKKLNRISFHRLLKADNVDSFLLTAKSLVPNTIESAIYVGTDDLEKLYDDDSINRETFISSRLETIRKITIKDLKFIQNHPNLFNSLLNEEMLNKLLDYKRSLNDISEDVTRYYKTIDYKRGPFRFVYTNDGSYNSVINNSDNKLISVLEKLAEINNSNSIFIYGCAEKSIFNGSSTIASEIIDNIATSFPSEINYIESLHNEIKSKISSTISMKLSICNGTTVFFYGDKLNQSNIKDFDILKEDCINTTVSMIRASYIGKVHRYFDEKEAIGKYFNDPVYNIIVRCVNSIKKKGITTYANILSGKKHVDGDELFYASLSEYGYNEVLNMISELIYQDILEEVYRKASFGIYTSIEVGDSLSEFGFSIEGLVNSTDFNSVDTKETEYLNLSEYLEKTKLLKFKQENFILKRIDVDDIKNMCTLITDKKISIKDINSALLAFAKDIDVIDENTKLFIKLKINLTRSSSMKSLFKYLLEFNKNVKEEM